MRRTPGCQGLLLLIRSRPCPSCPQHLSVFGLDQALTPRSVICLMMIPLQINTNGLDHEIIVVTLDSKDYIVDVGFGAQVGHTLVPSLRHFLAFHISPPKQHSTLSSPCSPKGGGVHHRRTWSSLSRWSSSCIVSSIGHPILRLSLFLLCPKE